MFYVYSKRVLTLYFHFSFIRHGYEYQIRCTSVFCGQDKRQSHEDDTIWPKHVVSWKTNITERCVKFNMRKYYKTQHDVKIHNFCALFYRSTLTTRGI